MKTIILPLLCGVLAGFFILALFVGASVSWSAMTFALLDAVCK